jgi:hypothetical protein
VARTVVFFAVCVGTAALLAVDNILACIGRIVLQSFFTLRPRNPACLKIWGIPFVRIRRPNPQLFLTLIN